MGKGGDLTHNRSVQVNKLATGVVLKRSSVERSCMGRGSTLTQPPADADATCTLQPDDVVVIDVRVRTTTIQEVNQKGSLLW